MAKISRKGLEIQRKAKVTKSNKRGRGGGSVYRVFVGFRVCKGQREGF